MCHPRRMLHLTSLFHRSTSPHSGPQGFPQDFALSMGLGDKRTRFRGPQESPPALVSRDSISSRNVEPTTFFFADDIASDLRRDLRIHHEFFVKIRRGSDTPGKSRRKKPRLGGEGAATTESSALAGEIARGGRTRRLGVHPGRSCAHPHIALLKLSLIVDQLIRL